MKVLRESGNSLRHVNVMELRQLGYSGFKVPALTFGTGTFGGGNEFFRAWGNTGVPEATRLVDICLDASLNMFDTADSYSDGLSEEILGKAISSRRDQVIIATKAFFGRVQHRTMSAVLATTSSAHARTVCGDCARITSTSIRCMGLMRYRPLTRP